MQYIFVTSCHLHKSDLSKDKPQNVQTLLDPTRLKRDDLRFWIKLSFHQSLMRDAVSNITWTHFQLRITNEALHKISLPYRLLFSVPLREWKKPYGRQQKTWEGRVRKSKGNVCKIGISRLRSGDSKGL